MKSGTTTANSSKRLQYKASRSCYNAFLLEAKAFNHLCNGCSNYRDLIPKIKPQNSMGRTYRCIIPSPNGIPMPVMQPVDHVSTCNLELEDTKPTRDRKQRKEKKGVAAEELLRKELELYKKKLTFHEKLNTDLTNRLVEQDALSKIELDAVKHELLEVKEELLGVKQDLHASQATANRAKSTAN